MSGVELGQVLDTLVPDWDMRPAENPPGNVLASDLRHIMDDSRSIFPKSVYTSQQAQDNRWSSIFKSDYKDIMALNRASSAPDGTRKDKMFMSWKVPERVTTGDGSRYSARSVRHSIEERHPTTRRTDKLENTHFPQIGTPSLPAQQQRSTSAMRYTPRLTSGMAKLTLGNDVMPRDVAKPNKPSTPRLPKGFKVSELLSRYYVPCASAEEWLHRASPAERQTVEKALVILEKNSKSNDKSSKTVDNWLKEATPAERIVALDFFQTVGTKLAGNTPEQKQRFNHVIEKLKRGRKHPGLLPTPDPSLMDSRFKYLRLLSADTRDQKWMHQTWHHLPRYNDTDPVMNKSAILTQPHKLTPRHYVIHPDLG